MQRERERERDKHEFMHHVYICVFQYHLTLRVCNISSVRSPSSTSKSRKAVFTFIWAAITPRLRRNTRRSASVMPSFVFSVPFFF